MISKQLLDHSLFLLKTPGDSSWIWPKQAFATEQSVGSWVINRVYNFLVLCLTCGCLVGILCNLSTPWSNIDWHYWPRVSGCTNYTRSIVGNEYCLTRQKMAAGGDYRVSFWTRNLEHGVNVCGAVWSWTGQQNEWFLSETGSGFEGLSSKPLPKLP